MSGHNKINGRCGYVGANDEWVLAGFNDWCGHPAVDDG